MISGRRIGFNRECCCFRGMEDGALDYMRSAHFFLSLSLDLGFFLAASAAAVPWGTGMEQRGQEGRCAKMDRGRGRMN